MYTDLVENVNKLSRFNSVWKVWLFKRFMERPKVVALQHTTVVGNTLGIGSGTRPALQMNRQMEFEKKGNKQTKTKLSNVFSDS